MFTEKYRPKKFSQIIGQDHIVKPVQDYIEKKKEIPNMLFSGDAGLGKTTLAHVVARNVLGNTWQNAFLELNASSDRGIAVVRERINNFAKTVGFHRFKIVFLDEASEITKDAQNALRRIMEVNYEHCRFILSCNYENKIIKPIKSRCQVYRFVKIQNNKLAKLVKRVAKKEGIVVKDSKVKRIVLEADGDARALLNLLESHIHGREIQGSAKLLQDILSLEIEEFKDLVYSVDNDSILTGLVSQCIKEKNKKAIIALADCDMRFRFGCIKDLQLIATFIKLKSILGE